MILIFEYIIFELENCEKGWDIFLDVRGSDFRLIGIEYAHSVNSDAGFPHLISSLQAWKSYVNDNIFLSHKPFLTRFFWKLNFDKFMTNSWHNFWFIINRFPYWLRSVKLHKMIMYLCALTSKEECRIRTFHEVLFSKIENRFSKTSLPSFVWIAPYDFYLMPGPVSWFTLFFWTRAVEQQAALSSVISEKTST